MGRWSWFILTTLLILLLPVLWAAWSFYFSPMDVGEGGCGAENVYFEQLNYARQFGMRIQIGLLILAVSALLATYNAFDSQIWLASLKKWGGFARTSLCFAIFAVVGLVYVQVASSWALMSPDACLYRALSIPPLAEAVPIGGSILPLDWGAALRINAAAASLLGSLTGSLIYLLLRNFKRF